MMRWSCCVLLCVLVLAGCAAPAAPVASSPPAAPPTPAPATAAPAPTFPPATLRPAPSTPTPELPTATVSPPTATPQPAPLPRFGYPIGLAGRVPGDGVFIRHGYAVENTWYNPGYWHTGEDWYALEGDTAGAEVYAAGAGDVVYVGSNYPGRVIIIRHADDLFSMYGHLDPAVEVQSGAQVERGTLLGTVLRRGDAVPNHLHFEMRSFLTTSAVNGEQPRYPFRCGVNCPPGPGYWPISAPDHPGAQGWRNPTHVIAARMFAPAAARPLGTVIVPSPPVSPSLTLWDAPVNNTEGSGPRGALPVQAGQRFPLLEVQAGPEDARTSSAEGYTLWYRIALPDGGSGWVQALTSSAFERGSDGRPASLVFHLIPG